MPRPASNRLAGLKLALAALVLMLVGWAAPAAAQTCSFSISDVNFGTVSPVSGASTVDSSGTLSINCSGLGLLGILPVTVGICPNLDAGTGGSNATGRLMKGSGSNTITYQLYQDSARSLPWGSAQLLNFTSVPTVMVTSDSSGNVHTSRTIYGRMTNPGTAPSGSYSSTFAGQSFYWGISVLGCGGVTIGTLVTPPSFNVLANVPVDCLLSAGQLDFGTAGLLTSAVNAQANISVSCTNGAPYSVALGPGGTGTGPTARKMVGPGGASIQYGLYKDSGRTSPWGDTAAGASTLASATGSGVSQTLTVYGQVPAQTTPAPGSYTDTVVITLTY